MSILVVAIKKKKKIVHSWAVCFRSNHLNTDGVHLNIFIKKVWLSSFGIFWNIIAPKRIFQ